MSPPFLCYDKLNGNCLGGFCLYRMIFRKGKPDMEEAMEKNSVELLTQILNDSNEMIQVSDLETFSMIYANDTAMKYTGHKDQSYKGLHCYEYMMGRKERCPFCPMNQIGNQESYKSEIDNGKDVFAIKAKKIQWDGKEAFIEYAWNITDIRRSQQAYQSQVQTLIAAIPYAQGIFHVDLTKDTIISIDGISAELAKMDGLSDVDTLIRTITTYIPEKENPEAFYQFFCRANLFLAYEGGKTEISKETLSYFDDGSIRPIRMTARFLVNPESNHLECIIYGIDISAEWKENKYFEQERNDLYRIFDALADSYTNVLLIDAEASKIKVLKVDGFVNAIFNKSRDTFYDFEEVKSKYVHKRVHPKDQEMMDQALSLKTITEKMASNQVYKGNYLVQENAESHYFQFKFVKLENIKYIIGGFQNTDEIVENEIAQRKQQEQQLAIFDILSRSYRNVYLANVNDGTARVLKVAGDYDLQMVQKLKKQVFPYENIMEYWIEERVHEEDKERVRQQLSVENLRNVLSKQEEYTGTYRSIDGGRMHHYQFYVAKMDNDGKVIAGFQFIDDIIEKHLAQEKEKQEKEEAYQRELKKQLQVINALGSEYKSLYLIDSEKNTWQVFKTDGSMLIQDALDQSAVSQNYDEVIRTYILNYVVEEDREYCLKHANLKSLLAETPDVGIHSLNYDRIIGNGRLHWQANTAKFTADDGKVYLVLGFRDVHDIVEKQIHQESALRDALIMANRASRAKTTFLNNMSHDIRTPMNAIIGFTALAKNSIGNREQVQDYLDKIHMSSTHLLGLINDILDMSRIESGIVKLEENAVYLPDVLKGLQTIIQGQVEEKKQILLIEQNISNAYVITDKLRLNQVILNIVSNAIKYTDCGGKISVQVEEKPSEKSGYASYEFRIRDNGMGMSKEFAESVFDIFARERSSTISGIQGTGLGMSIAKNIVDMMNGTITVESEPRKGSEFIVQVDFKLLEETSVDSIVRTLDEKEKANSNKKVELINRDYSGKRILLVEDNELNREITTTILEDSGMLIDTAEDGIEAVSIMNQAPENQYDLILMDIQMPRMDGYTATREIRTLKNNKKANIPIVAMTANAFDEDRKKSFEAGMNDHIAKPIDMNVMIEVLDKIFFQKKL